MRKKIDVSKKGTCAFYSKVFSTFADKAEKVEFGYGKKLQYLKVHHHIWLLYYLQSLTSLDLTTGGR